MKDLSVEHCTWYILTGRMEGEKKKTDRTVFLLSYGSRTGDFFSFQMMTRRKGPRLFSKYNILVIQIARGVMKDRCVHAC